MVGNALTLQQQRAQPGSTLGNRGLRCRFQRHAIGPGIAHGGVARDAPGQPAGVQRRQLRHAMLDALVRVAQALLQTQHFLPHHREAEMAGLDDAGMHRAHGNLMDAVAVHMHKRVIDELGRRQQRQLARVLLQREMVWRPGAVVEPGPRVLGAQRMHARQVGGSPLHAHGSRKHRAKVGINPAPFLLQQRQRQPERTVKGDVSRAHAGRFLCHRAGP